MNHATSPAVASGSRGGALLGVLGLAVISLGACSGPSAPDEQGGGAVLTETHPEAMRARGWLEFADLSLRLESDGKDPVGMHVRGWVVGGLFFPDGDVEGRKTERPRGRIFTAGFLELRTRGFVKKDAARRPRPPFVEGFQDVETGAFFPTSSVRYGGRRATGTAASGAGSD